MNGLRLRISRGFAGYAAILGVAVFAVGLADPLPAAELSDFPDADTEKHCTSAGESPECVAKTFMLCSDKSVATCKLAGLNVQPEGTQYKDDGTLVGDVWTRPWTLSWTELLGVTHANYAIWEIKGLRQVVPGRLRGVPWTRRPLTGTHELMIDMVTAQGESEKQSVFLARKQGTWVATGYARWRDDEYIDTCERRKFASLACRYAIPGLLPW